MGLADELREVEIDKELKLKVFNEVRETIIEMYFDLRKQNGGGEEYDKYIGNLHDLDILAMLEENAGKFDEEEIFTLKNSVIHDEWKKRKARLLVKKKSDIAGIMSPSTNLHRALSRKGSNLSKKSGRSANNAKEDTQSNSSIQKISK